MYSFTFFFFFLDSIGWLTGLIQTNDNVWKQRLDGLLGTTLKTFFPPQYGGQIMSDQECEPKLACDGNSACFKGILASSLAVTTTIVPEEADKIMPKLKSSAEAAAKTCSGGNGGNDCGQRWYQPTWDGSAGLEQQTSVMSILSSTLIAGAKQAPKTSNTGGTSKGDPNAGTGGGGGIVDKGPILKPITTGDRAGAGILTGVFVASWIGGSVWLVSG